MDIIGTIVGSNEQRTGTSANGNQWTSQDFVADVSQPGAQYPSHLVFSVFGADKIQQFNLQQGQTYRIFYDFRGRQASDGRWFGSVQAWKVEPHNAQQQQMFQQQQQPQFQQPVQPGVQNADENLPF